EVPFIFGERVSGESKASLRQGVRFVVQLATLRWEMWWATKRAREILTFGVVGVANLVLDVGMFNLLVLEFGREAIAAKFVSTSVATVASYFMNRHWTWRHRARSRVHRELAVFTLLSLVALAVAEGCLWVSHSLGYSSTLADNIAANGVGLAIGMVWRFWSFRKWVFTAPDEPAETAAAAPAQQRVLVEVD
ncbi:MAG TPA: GtrA family protein, partial [Acidothermaceae bacterium]|nr:GtrA family protein [Acidothermaceae bacterium]